MPLNNSQYNELMREYDRRLSSREAEIARRRKELFAAEPELRTIEDALRAAHISRSRAKLSGDDTADIDQQISSLDKRKDFIFSTLHFPNDYLDVPYVCPDCKDTGYIDGAKCHCFIHAANDLLFKHSGMARHLRHGLSSFRLDIYDNTEKDPAGRTSLDYAKALLTDGRQLLSSFPSATSFYIYGNTGTGKTYFACCLATEIINLGYSSLFIKAPDFIDLCYQRFDDREGEVTAMYESLFDCDFLVLDDWGTALSTRSSHKLLLNLIDSRLSAQKPTAITSNISLIELKVACDERIFSRIAGDYKAYHFFGMDQRTKPK